MFFTRVFISNNTPVLQIDSGKHMSFKFRVDVNTKKNGFVHKLGLFSDLT